jgi:hypothetical protein
MKKENEELMKLTERPQQIGFFRMGKHLNTYKESL